MTQYSVLGLLTVTRVDSLRPCMFKRHVADISAFLEPSATTGATAAFARSFGRGALATYRAQHLRRPHDKWRHRCA